MNSELEAYMNLTTPITIHFFKQHAIGMGIKKADSSVNQLFI